MSSSRRSSGPSGESGDADSKEFDEYECPMRSEDIEDEEALVDSENEVKESYYGGNDRRDQRRGAGLACIHAHRGASLPFNAESAYNNPINTKSAQSFSVHDLQRTPRLSQYNLDSAIVSKPLRGVAHAPQTHRRTSRSKGRSSSPKKPPPTSKEQPRQTMRGPYMKSIFFKIPSNIKMHERYRDSNSSSDVYGSRVLELDSLTENDPVVEARDDGLEGCDGERMLEQDGAQGEERTPEKRVDLRVW